VVENLGLLAALLTTASFIPQVYKVVMTRDTTSISRSMYVVLTCGVACWLAYGVLTRNLPITLANGATLFLAGTVLLYKMRYR
jgi:MtN3 and saliva related transmembrane protein